MKAPGLRRRYSQRADSLARSHQPLLRLQRAKRRSHPSRHSSRKQHQQQQQWVPLKHPRLAHQAPFPTTAAPRAPPSGTFPEGPQIPYGTLDLDLGPDSPPGSSSIHCLTPVLNLSPAPTLDSPVPQALGVPAPSPDSPHSVIQDAFKGRRLNVRSQSAPDRSGFRILPDPTQPFMPPQMTPDAAAVEVNGVEHPAVMHALQKDVEQVQVGSRNLSTGPSFAQLIPSEPELARKPRESLRTGLEPAGYLCRRVPQYAASPPIETVVFAWGVSEDAQLGLNTGVNILTPKVVEATLGLRLSGRKFNRTPIVAGSRNTLVIDGSGQVWSWGWNERGTLGHGHRAPERKPRAIPALRGVNIVQVAIGGWHCLALGDNGALYAWGGNEYVQCGVDAEQRDIVSPVLAVPQLKVTMVAAGGMHSLALTESGEVWTWGEPWGDFAMKVARHPRQVTAAVDVAAIACGAFHNMALTRSGEVYTWGTNDYGQLGNGNTSYQTVPSLVMDLDLLQVSDIAAGGWHSAALTTTGELWVWGRGEYGRLGLSDRTGSSKLRPQRVMGLAHHKVVQVVLGGTHSIALTSRDRMFVWGRGSYGRLGLGPEKDLYHPVELQLPGGHECWRVIAVAAGGRHSMCVALPVRDGGSAAQAAAELAEAAADQPDGVSADGDSEPSLYDRDMDDGLGELPSPPAELSSIAAEMAQHWPTQEGNEKDQLTSEEDDGDDDEDDDDEDEREGFSREERHTRSPISRARSPSYPRSPLVGSPASSAYLAMAMVGSPRTRSPFLDAPASPRGWQATPSLFANDALRQSLDAAVLRSPSQQGSVRPGSYQS
ncbi:MAG: hypothetical protein WDW36_002037 [Sanguina aurantia]